MNLPTLTIHEGQPMAHSRDVAGIFEKRHADLLRAYRGLECSADFRQRNFASFYNKDLTGESLSHVLMTKNGFAFLVLGFTGSKAAAFKEAYIERFDAMERELARQSMPAIPTTFAEALQLAADKAREVEAQAERIAVLEPRAAALTTLAETEGTFCIRDAAKALGEPEKALRAYLSRHGWIYRRAPTEPWVARAERLNAGLMRTKVVPVETGSGAAWNRPQARITSRGLAFLAVRLGKPVPPEAQQSLPLALPAPARA